MFPKPLRPLFRWYDETGYTADVDAESNRLHVGIVQNNVLAPQHGGETGNYYSHQHLFREFLTKHGFIEIHTPKLIGGASEGGSDVFTLDYFGQPACLAMSPQLHKQMSAACSGFERVFEVGPVFRAENSNTHRHLCEFTGLDLEMAIHEHYDEVLHMMSEMFVYIFDGIKERCKVEIERVREQHPFEDLQLSFSIFVRYARWIVQVQNRIFSRPKLNPLML